MFVKLAFLLVLGLAFQKVYADEPESIVGGTDASVGEFPYQISLRRNGFHICGGSIISDRHIITAAHCVDGGQVASLTVVTGAIKLNDPWRQTHRIKSYTIHPGYIPNASHSWVNDAAVITLAQPMQFNANQKPIAVATSDPPVKAALTISGWGAQRVGGPSPNHLQKATLYYVSKEQCQSIHANMPIFATHLCALHSAGIGACSGDSGGPLVYKGELVGIASWVSLCARGVPDVFTRAAKYQNFIDSVMREL